MTDIIRLLIAASTHSYRTMCDELTRAEAEELHELVELLEQEYNIKCAILVQEDVKQLLQCPTIKEKYFTRIEKQLHTPNPMYLKQKMKYPPPKIGKLNNKPKGRKH